MDPEGLVTFEAGGERYTAVFGFKAMKAVEAHWDKPFFRAIQEIMPSLSADDMGDQAKIAEASMDVKFTDIGALFGFALLKHHPGLTENAVDDLIDEVGGLKEAAGIIGQSLASALAEGDDSSPKNPRKPRSPRNRTG